MASVSAHAGHTITTATAATANTSDTPPGGGPSKDTVMQGCDMAGGAVGGAIGGAAQVPGNDLKSTLQGLVDQLKALIDKLTAMTSGSGKTKQTGGGCMGGTTQTSQTSVMGSWGGGAPDAGITDPEEAARLRSQRTGREDDAFEQRVLELVNAERRAQTARDGIYRPDLVYNRNLDVASEAHNKHQATVVKMAHEGIGDSDPGARARQAGWRRAWGENVARGQTSPEQVVREWMASPGHRRNILNAEFQYSGISHKESAGGMDFWAQEFGK